MSKEQQDTLREHYVKKHNGLHAVGTPVILTEGGEVEQLTMTAVDAQLLESRSFQVIDICRAFGVPPFMVGEMSKATSWGSGVSEMGRAFVLYSLRPYMNRYEAESNRKCFRSAKYFAEFDPSRLTRGDPAAEAAYNRQAVGGSMGPGWMTIDEIRARSNQPPKGGACDAVYFPTAPASDGPAVPSTDKGPSGGEPALVPDQPDPEDIPE